MHIHGFRSEREIKSKDRDGWFPEEIEQECSSHPMRSVCGTDESRDQEACVRRDL